MKFDFPFSKRDIDIVIKEKRIQDGMVVYEDTGVIKATAIRYHPTKVEIMDETITGQWRKANDVKGYLVDLNLELDGKDVRLIDEGKEYRVVEVRNYENPPHAQILGVKD